VTQSDNEANELKIDDDGAEYVYGGRPHCITQIDSNGNLRDATLSDDASLAFRDMLAMIQSQSHLYEPERIKRMRRHLFFSFWAAWED